mmetsp:Transcript_24036/g.43535  ORF Transcript_24036/g.43535 Transcript_24036/m.43535 type:complete len:481 (+) Transcript_24036:92-1534(+)|eukprot:CAMPEP_0197654570 /NCGR_PEP_ID=MMETSP1338-20131121/38925_1 /TAXON_ID=43686 ORGANISM="Pelagodinium beii, Strain RCC1491" /NCGR_SAMPLE_ID=MMETSP1338 /ASSEMBLY_ACC=CAM_ASM_000754 /LENGTH=480 /DNA_ID=CAMNT_0043230037 /DNA_START=98 /DNA_END=1540 /DNA_ORIENTATION=+
MLRVSAAFAALALAAALLEKAEHETQPTKQNKKLIREAARPATKKKRRSHSYYWPSARGHQKQYTFSNFPAAFDLTADLKWSWSNPKGRYDTSPTGVGLDDEKNIFMSELSGIRKFSPMGLPVWVWRRPNGSSAELGNALSLLDGKAFTSSTDGRAYAISMETGNQIWSTKVGNASDMSNGFVSAHAGRVVLSTDASEYSRGKQLRVAANSNVKCLDASTGAILWQFLPEAPVRSFLANFPDDGSVVFQDIEGKVYRLSLADGTVMWKNGGIEGSWTDGAAQLGNNGIIYAVSNFGQPDAAPDMPGLAAAYNVTDGSLIWNRTTSLPPSNVPAVGYLQHASMSLVVPLGVQGAKGNPTSIVAYDGLTGAERWTFHGPVQTKDFQAGDFEGGAGRNATGVHPLTLSAAWSAPAIDAMGTVFVGSQQGKLFSLRDLDGDGDIIGPNEVSAFPTDASFVGSSGPAFAPGLMAIASIDQLFVFR